MAKSDRFIYVLTGCTTTGIVLSTWKVMGLFFIHLQRDTNSSAKTVSLVLGLVSAMSYLYGPIHAVVYERFGARTATALGGLLTAFGISLSSVITRIETIGAIYGIFPGFGIGITNLAFFTMSSDIFRNKLSLVNNTFSASHSIAAVMLAPLTQILINTYGWRGALLILGGLILQAVPVSLINSRYYEKLKLSRAHPAVDSRFLQSQTETRGMCERLKSLLRDPIFIIYAFSMTFTTVSKLSVILYTVRFTQSVGISDEKAVSVVTVQETLSLICAPLIGYLTSSPSKNTQVEQPAKKRLSLVSYVQRIPRPCSHAFLSILFGFSVLVPVIAESYTGFMISGALNGIILGGNTALPVTVLADLFGSRDLAMAQGVRCLMAGIGSIFYPLLIGSVIDNTGSYSISAYGAELLSWTSAFLTVITYITIKRGRSGTRESGAHLREISGINSRDFLGPVGVK